MTSLSLLAGRTVVNRVAQADKVELDAKAILTRSPLTATFVDVHK